MSELHIRHIRTALEQGLAHQVGIDDVVHHPKSQLESHRLTRALAAYVVKVLGNFDDSSAASAVIDGSKDNGIDAIHYDPSGHTVLVVQAKWSTSGAGGWASGDVHKLIQGLKDLLNANFLAFNERCQSKRKELKAALVLQRRIGSSEVVA